MKVIDKFFLFLVFSFGIYFHVNLSAGDYVEENFDALGGGAKF